MQRCTSLCLLVIGTKKYNGENEIFCWCLQPEPEFVNYSIMEPSTGILKLFRIPGIDSASLVVWRAGTTTIFLLGSYSPHRMF
jgi:hypothetical protein